MGVMNLLKANWDGKVGKTVGAKWKDKSTIRSYTKPANPNTADQQKVRAVFASMTSFVALFADQIKYKSALNTAGMSVRNAIIKLNKEQIDAGAFDETTLVVSKGGLQRPQGLSVELDSNNIKATWTPPTATNFTDNAKAILIAVDAEDEVVDVVEAAADAGTATGTIAFGATSKPQCYLYFLDKRGSNKVASNSVAAAVA